MAENYSTATVKTYNCREVYITLGSHLVSGYAEDNFVSYEPAGDGTSAVVGCDGEISRAIDPNGMYTVKLVIQQTSSTNKWLQEQYELDRTNGNGLFSMSIRDFRGGSLFNASACWLVKPGAKTLGKGTTNREWNFYAAGVTDEEGTYSSYSTT